MRVTLLLAACVLASCTALRVGYNHGESVVYWWMNGYLDFDADQQPWVRQRIGELLTWHRSTQLKDYVILLTHQQQRLRRNVSKGELLADVDDLKQRSLQLADRALPALADLALSLRPHQLQQMRNKFADNNAKFRKDYLKGDAEQRQRFRYQQVLEQAEYWFGGFSREQERLIRQASDARPLDNEFWLAQRVRRQNDMLALLTRIQTEKPSRDATIALLRAYLVAILEQSGNADRRAFLDNSTDSSAHMAMTIINSTTPQQKAHAMRKLQSWIDDFNALAADGKSPGGDLAQAVGGEAH